MNANRSPVASGLNAALRHWRLAGVLWLSLVLPAGLACVPLGRMAAPLDDSPFRETLLAGWDSWAVLSWLRSIGPAMDSFGPLLVLVVAASAFLQLFLSGGVLRALLADVRRPVLGRVLTESVALFRPYLRAFGRFVLALVLRGALFAALPAVLLTKLAGKDAPPHGTLSTVAFWWALVAGIGVYLMASLRFDLARIALARGDSPTSRGAHRVARARLTGSRPSAVALLVSWLFLGLVVQAVFTNLGVRMNPSTGGGLLALLLVRQGGFLVLAMVRVGFWASLLSWEAARRPRAARPVFVPQAAAATGTAPGAPAAAAPAESLAEPSPEGQPG